MKKPLTLVLVYYFIQGFVHNLGHPVTPTFVNQLGIEPRMFGFFFSFMSLGLVVGAPLWGILGDARHKKPFIVSGLLIYSLGQLLFGLSSNPWWMTGWRFLAGFGVSAAVTLFLAHIVGLTEKEERTKYLSISAALLALGSTVGYQVGGILGETIIREVFLWQAFLNTVYAGLILFTFKETVQTKVSQSSVFSQFKAMSHLSPGLLLFLFSLALATMSMTILSKYLDVYIIDLGYSTRVLGTFVMVTGLVGLATNFFLVPFLTRFKKDVIIMRYAQVVSAVLVFLVFRSNEIFVALYTLYMLYMVSRSIFQPLEQNHISLSADASTYGRIMGVRQMFFAIGMVLGPLMAGFIYEINPVLVFDVSAVIFLLAFVLMTLSQKSFAKEALRNGQQVTPPSRLETPEYQASP